MEKTKDVEIKGHKFRIGCPLAADGSWIVGVAFGQHYYEPENYARAQSILFNECLYLRDAGGQTMPILLYKNGKWLVPELDMERDTEMVDALYDEAVDFCLGPTLERRFKKILAAKLRAEQAQATGQ